MSDAETMMIELPRAVADELRRSVEAGQFPSNSRAIEAALRAWRDAHDVTGYSPEELRDLVAVGIASGPSSIGAIADLKIEARRRWQNGST